MDKDELLIPELNEGKIESMIYEIRGQKVMLDFELAKIYGYETRDFNNQIKHNIERFDDDFRFQLNEIEWNEFLLWKKSTANNLTKRRTLPYAFTEQGAYMLMTVLKIDFMIDIFFNFNKKDTRTNNPNNWNTSKSSIYHPFINSIT